jgi:hypothetical protein
MLGVFRRMGATAGIVVLLDFCSSPAAPYCVQRGLGKTKVLRAFGHVRNIGYDGNIVTGWAPDLIGEHIGRPIPTGAAPSPERPLREGGALHPQRNHRRHTTYVYRQRPFVSTKKEKGLDSP